MIDSKRLKKVRCFIFSRIFYGFYDVLLFFLAFNQAGFKNEAIKVLEELTYNAVAENRFTDASYYYWLMSNEHLQVVCGMMWFFIVL